MISRSFQRQTLRSYRFLLMDTPNAGATDESTMKPTEGELIPTRATLLHRLKNWEDNNSWHEFFNIYWRLIYGIARKAGLREEEAQDVVQETLISVAKHMPAFKYDPAIGSFKSW